MKTREILRLAGAAAALGGALRVAAAFIPSHPDSAQLELLYFVIDLSLLFGLIGIYAQECERLGWIGLVGFVAAASGLASIVGPDSDVFGFNIYGAAVSVIGIGLAIMSVAMLWRGHFPPWIPALWIASLLAGLAPSFAPDASQAAFQIAGALFALGFLAAGVALFSRPGS